jgi:DNA helicase HerA-like ATPase
VEKAILELSVGEALVSMMEAGGAPGMTERAWVLPPGTRIGPLTPEERQAVMQASLVAGTYEKEIDRESAFEMLRARTAANDAPAAASNAGGSPLGGGAGANAGGGAAAAGAAGAVLGGLGGLIFGTTGPRGGKRDGMVDIVAKSAARSVGNSIARSLVRGVLGSLLGGTKRR